jgi:hypothetical protein
VAARATGDPRPVTRAEAVARRRWPGVRLNAHARPDPDLEVDRVVVHWYDTGPPADQRDTEPSDGVQAPSGYDIEVAVYPSAEELLARRIARMRRQAAYSRTR